MTELTRSDCEDCGRIVYERGSDHMIEAAQVLDGSFPVEDFLTGLERSRKRVDKERLANIALLLEDYADGNELAIPRELNTLRDGIKELKREDVRLPFFALARSKAGTVRLTHGFIKKQQKTERKQIDRALWVRKEDREVDNGQSL